MTGRFAMLAFVAAVTAVQTLAVLPGTGVQAAGLGIAFCAGLTAWRLKKGRVVQGMLLCVSAACGGAVYAIERGQMRLSHHLPLDHENQVTRATLRIATLPEWHAQTVRFEAQVLTSQPIGLPPYIRVTWPYEVKDNEKDGKKYNDLANSLLPGQQWRMALLMKRPHAAMNPHSVDGEARLFQRNIRATAIVRGRPRFLTDDGWSGMSWAVARLRSQLRQRMQKAVAGTRYGAVIIALALGDQAGVAPEDWRLFNATGITHLVSISGLHVSLVAGLAGAVVGALWRRMRWRGQGVAEKYPAQAVSLVMAVIVAGAYCMLAGWGIPARRTFFTLAVAAVSVLTRWPVAFFTRLLCVACTVTLLDPWAPIAPGFWLSFGAVAVVLAWTQGTYHPIQMQMPRWRQWQQRVYQATRLQCVVTLALTPLLAFLTQQVAVTAPLANAIAIPMVSFLVTPLALLCALLCIGSADSISAAWAGGAAECLFGWTMQGVAWLAQRPWAVWEVAAPPAACVGLAVVGIGWALLPPGLGSRRWAWFLLLPALCWRPSRPSVGEWRLVALDVGQGGAIVVETRQHTLVFDTGPRHREGADGAERVVLPYLRARGLRQIDTLVVSHGDQDHAGGLDTLLRTLPVFKAYAPFSLAERLAREAQRLNLPLAPMPREFLRCRAGQAWQVDGVRFDFLHPQTSVDHPKRTNAQACVLRIQGKYHAALLPGDVGAAEERLFAHHLSNVAVVVAPHHGSATSSSWALIQATQARHVIAQVGYLNPFHHPVAKVIQRWQCAGAVFWRTDSHGAVVVNSDSRHLKVHAYREQARRYWHVQAE